MNEGIVEIRKQINALIAESRRRAKRSECLWCGEKITSFCNSHSVPRCVLKNIEIDGKVDYYNSLVELPFLDVDKGIKEAGVFRLLCRSCDSKLFKDYENPSSLKELPTDNMLAEIALKNILVMMNKRLIEREISHFICENKGNSDFISTQLKIEDLDLRDYELDYWRARKAVLGEAEQKNYKIVFWKKIDHIIPIAFQGLVTLYGDLKGNIVNDVYNNDEKVKIQSLHVCLFPLMEESIVCVFCHQDDHNYDEFICQFKALSEEEKLKFLGYLLFVRCEDMLLAKRFPHRTWVINRAGELFRATPGIKVVGSESEQQFKIQQERCQLLYRDTSFPNLFDSKFAFQNTINRHMTN